MFGKLEDSEIWFSQAGIGVCGGVCIGKQWKKGGDAGGLRGFIETE